MSICNSIATTTVKGVDLALAVPRTVLRGIGFTAEKAGQVAKHVGLPAAAFLLVDGYLYNSAEWQLRNCGLYNLGGCIPQRSLLTRLVDPSMRMSLNDTIDLMKKEIPLGLIIGTTSVVLTLAGRAIKDLTYAIADAIKLT